MIKRLIQVVSRKQMGANTSKNIYENVKLASMNANILYHRFSSKRSTKSTITTTFHRSQTPNGEMLSGKSNQMIDQNDDCSELNELKNYFLSHENDELEESDDFFDDQKGLSQVDLNEGGESDFSEEFEKALQNSKNQKRSNDKSLFDMKFGQQQNPSIPQKSGVFCNNNGQGETQQNQDLLDDSVEKKGLMYLRKNKNNPTFLEKKFGLNISSDPRERQSDLQRFVLKSLQLLSAKQIQHFIQIIEYFKSKLTSHNFKKSQNVHEEFFMRQVFKLFENNQAEELMDLFLKCDLIDININLFTNNVADYEKSYEIKNKHKQFDAFNKQNQPNGNTFLLNDLAEKYNNLDYLKYSTLQNNEEIEDQIDEIDIDTYDRSNGITSTQSSQKFYVISNELTRFQKNDQLPSRTSGQLKYQSSSVNQESRIYNNSNNGFKDVILGDTGIDKEQQLFKKVAMYEYEKQGNIQKLDSKIFDQLSQTEQKNPKVLNPLCQKYDILKVENIQTNWNSSLLEDEYFPSQSVNGESRTFQQQNTFCENFILQPTEQSQQKIIQIGRQFENQFDNNLNLIDDINSDYMSSSQSNLPSANSQSNLKLQEKDFFELLNLESERAAISTKKINRIHNNKMVLKQTFERDIQQHDEVLILKQEESLIPKKFEKTTWVYMYHLPYDLNEVPNYTTYIKNFVESTFGEIEDIQFVNYKDFFEIEKIRFQEDTVNRNLRDSLQEQFIQTNTTTTTTGSEKPKKKESKTATSSQNIKNEKFNMNTLTDDELLQHIYTNNKINPDFCSRALKRTEKILEKIQNKKEKKYNRSYAMIKFKSMNSKEKCLSQDIRLFGVQSFNEVFSFDDADYKKSLIISKIPWGINLQYLITKLNQQFKQNGLKHIKISMENINLKKVVTKYFLLLKLDNYKDSLDVIKAFMKNDFMIETSKLSCNHSYGSLKQGPQGFYEITDYYNKNVELLERVNERKVFEIWNIYKENTGYLNSIRPILNIKEEDDSDDIEIKEDELVNYNEIDHDMITQRFQSSTLTSQINSQAGFSKSSQYFQQKSISDKGYFEPTDLNEEIELSELFGEITKKQN